MYEDEPNLQTKQEPHPFGWSSCFSYCLLHIRLRDGGIQLIGGGVRRLGLFALLLPAGLFALRAVLRLDALCQQQEQHQVIAQQIEKWLARWADLRAQSAVPLEEAAWQQPDALRTACAEAGQQIAQLQQNLADAETAERQLQQAKDACQAAVQHQRQIEHAQASTRQALQSNLSQQEQTAQALDGLVERFRINWVWMPPWGPERITDDGRDMMRALGFAI